MAARCGSKLEPEISARRKDEHTSELPGITLHGGLSCTASQGTNRISDQLRRSHLTTAAPKTRCAIRMQIGVDEQEALYLEFLTKRLCKVPISIPHDDDFDALISPRLHRVTQLRDLLTTEQSTEVAQEDENNRLALPQIAQTDWLVRC